jgi:hypothetical protein
MAKLKLKYQKDKFEDGVCCTHRHFITHDDGKVINNKETRRMAMEITMQKIRDLAIELGKIGYDHQTIKFEITEKE